jgi:Saxitoxin biosynthesis operon protein SxtJ
MKDTNESFDRDEVKTTSDRSFGLFFAAVFALIAFWPMAAGGGPRLWVMALAIIFFAAALVYPRLLHQLNRLWFRIGLLLHHVVTPVVMGLIFFFGFLPTALIMGMRRRDPLRTTRASAVRQLDRSHTARACPQQHEASVLRVSTWNSCRGSGISFAPARNFGCCPF